MRNSLTMGTVATTELDKAMDSILRDKVSGLDKFGQVIWAKFEDVIDKLNKDFNIEVTLKEDFKVLTDSIEKFVGFLKMNNPDLHLVLFYLDKKWESAYKECDVAMFSIKHTIVMDVNKDRTTTNAKVDKIAVRSPNISSNIRETY